MDKALDNNKISTNEVYNKEEENIPIINEQNEEPKKENKFRIRTLVRGRVSKGGISDIQDIKKNQQPSQTEVNDKQSTLKKLEQQQVQNKTKEDSNIDNTNIAVIPPPKITINENELYDTSSEYSNNYNINNDTFNKSPSYSYIQVASQRQNDFITYDYNNKNYLTNEFVYDTSLKHHGIIYFLGTHYPPDMYNTITDNILDKKRQYYINPYIPTRRQKNYRNPAVYENSEGHEWSGVVSVYSKPFTVSNLYQYPQSGMQSRTRYAMNIQQEEVDRAPCNDPAATANGNSSGDSNSGDSSNSVNNSNNNTSVNTNDNSTVNTNDDNTVNTNDDNTVNTNDDNTVNTNDNNTMNTNDNNTVNTNDDNTMNTKDNNTVNTNDDNTVNTNNNNTVNTNDNNTVNTKDNNTVDTNDNNTVNTKDNNTVDTKDNNTVNTNNNNTVNTSNNNIVNTNNNIAANSNENNTVNIKDNSTIEEYKHPWVQLQFRAHCIFPTHYELWYQYEDNYKEENYLDNLLRSWVLEGSIIRYVEVPNNNILFLDEYEREKWQNTYRKEDNINWIIDTSFSPYYTQNNSLKHDEACKSKENNNNNNNNSSENINKNIKTHCQLCSPYLNSNLQIQRSPWKIQDENKDITFKYINSNQDRRILNVNYELNGLKDTEYGYSQFRLRMIDVNTKGHWIQQVPRIEQYGKQYNQAVPICNTINNDIQNTITKSKSNLSVAFSDMVQLVDPIEPIKYTSMDSFDDNIMNENEYDGSITDDEQECNIIDKDKNDNKQYEYTTDDDDDTVFYNLNNSNMNYS